MSCLEKSLHKKAIVFFLLSSFFIYPLLAAEIPSEFLTRKLKKRNPELSISLVAVLKMEKEGKKITFIDVRPELEFEKFHIPGSINIPLFAIKTKTFLKSRGLVLVNEGYSYTQLEQECLNLRSAGFSVWILDGGLNYWKQAGSIIEGDMFAQKDLNKIAPEMFFLEKDYDNWLIIDVSEPKNSGAGNLITDVIHIPFSDQGKEFISKFKKELEERNNIPFLSVLVLNKTGGQYEKIEKEINKLGVNNVFYLKDGLDGYRVCLKNKMAIPQAHATITSTGGTTGASMINKPCGTCR